MKIMSGNGNLPLARAVAAYLELPLTDASVRRFADEEVFVEIHENVRGEDVFIVQSTSFPANDHLMELLIMIDAARRSSARATYATLFRPIAIQAVAAGTRQMSSAFKQHGEARRADLPGVLRHGFDD